MAGKKQNLTRVVDVGLEGREGVLALAGLHGGLMSYKVLPIVNGELLELTFATSEAKKLFEREYAELAEIELQRDRNFRKK
jgi:hypothetical protein